MNGESGSVLMVGWVGLGVAAVALVLVVDLTAYLVAGARSRAAADAAALAAVSANHPEAPEPPLHPREAARRVAAANNARLDDCRCPRGAREVEVRVSVGVRSVAVWRFAGRRVTATARARLVHAERPPERERQAGFRRVRPSRSPPRR
ncbi:MAG: hypothetical protein ACRDUY_16545 [Nitriliruptorales bacterium]